MNLQNISPHFVLWEKGGNNGFTVSLIQKETFFEGDKAGLRPLLLK